MQQCNKARNSACIIRLTRVVKKKWRQHKYCLNHIASRSVLINRRIIVATTVVAAFNGLHKSPRKQVKENSNQPWEQPFPKTFPTPVSRKHRSENTKSPKTYNDADTQYSTTSNQIVCKYMTPAEKPVRHKITTMITFSAWQQRPYRSLIILSVAKADSRLLPRPISHHFMLFWSACRLSSTRTLILEMIYK